MDFIWVSSLQNHVIFAMWTSGMKCTKMQQAALRWKRAYVAVHGSPPAPSPRLSSPGPATGCGATSRIHRPWPRSGIACGWNEKRSTRLFSLPGRRVDWCSLEARTGDRLPTSISPDWKIQRLLFHITLLRVLIAFGLELN
ncbi:hypothetical protein ONE63_009754 [Megalurothrips usitatus]|uniref:Uncharacterized protein n=1 Tax=Megalurothrips usitatus TaxID=439358 RepID=A0AAV7XJZ0_9NEOP|nr:hypothetical protein ONE63_009754 [Megalurothrips usitatus]